MIGVLVIATYALICGASLIALAVILHHIFFREMRKK